MRLKIDRLKLRVPAESAGSPETLARAVAEQLAGETGAVGPGRRDSVTVRLPAAQADGPGAIARAIGGALKGRGHG